MISPEQWEEVYRRTGGTWELREKLGGERAETYQQRTDRLKQAFESWGEWADKALKN